MVFIYESESGIPYAKTKNKEQLRQNKENMGNLDKTCG